MAGKNRLMAKLVASSTTITPDSDYIATNLTKTQSQSASLSVYSSIDSLPTSAAAGTKALVTSTNTLYIYNNGWYKIAIINAFNPQWITQPDSEYTLDLGNIDSEILITVLANDSDDVPITYSVVLDSDANQLINIVHDSDKDNIWRVSLQDSDQGSGSVTFRASDGVNVVNSYSVNFNFNLGVSIQDAMASGSGIYDIYAADGNDAGTLKSVYVHATKGMLYVSFASDGLNATTYPAWQANRMLHTQLTSNGFTIAPSWLNYGDGVTNNQGGYSRPSGSYMFFAAAANVANLTLATYNGPLTSGGSAINRIYHVTSSQFSNQDIYVNGSLAQNNISTSKTTYNHSITLSSATNANVAQYRETNGIFHIYDIWVKPV